jgi:hypothetical protein
MANCTCGHKIPDLARVSKWSSAACGMPLHEVLGASSGNITFMCERCDCYEPPNLPLTALPSALPPAFSGIFPYIERTPA